MFMSVLQMCISQQLVVFTFSASTHYANKMECNKAVRGDESSSISLISAKVMFVSRSLCVYSFILVLLYERHLNQITSENVCVHISIPRSADVCDYDSAFR